jgi:5'-3' exonuclease
MGIKDLNGFIKNYQTKNNIKLYSTIPLSDIKNSKIAIDLSEYLYKYYNIAKKRLFEDNMVLREKENGSWVPISESMIQYYVCRQFVSFISMFKKHGIIPIFVFDGNPGAEKDITKNDRKNIHANNKVARQKMLIDGTFEEYKKSELACNVPDGNYKELLSCLFSILKVDFYHADGEADTLCSQLCRNGVVNSVLSRDSDQIAYNTKIIIREIKIQDGIPFITFTTSNVIRMILGLNIEQLTQFCVLCGSDYNSNVTNYGPVKSLELIRKYGDIHRIIVNNPLFDNFKWEHSYDIFTKDIVVPKINPIKCNISEFDQIYGDKLSIYVRNQIM